MADKKLKLGIIGCGIAAKELHWPVLQELSDQFEVAALCNHSRPKADNLAKIMGDFYKKEIPVHLDYKDLLAEEDIDAVSILLPVELNHVVAKAAAEAGKHILLEKPIAKNRECAQELLNLEKQYPLLTMMVAENFRYREIYHRASEILRQGKIGQPYYVEWVAWQKVVPGDNQYADTFWRQNHQYEGGFITDGGVHNVAVLRDIFGDFELLGASSFCVNPDIGRTDSLMALFKTKGKEEIPPLTGLLNFGFSVNGLAQFHIRILGTKASLVLEWDSLSIFPGDKNEAELTEKFSSEGGYLPEYVDFYNAIIQNKTPLSTFQKAYGDLDTILTALEAR